MPLLRISVGRLFHSRGPATEKLFLQSVTVSVRRHTCRPSEDLRCRRSTSVTSCPTGTAEQDHAMNGKQAPTFEINSLFHGQLVELLTVAVELDRQKCRTATRYSSPVDMTRMTELTSSWRHPTANAQSIIRNC